MFQVATGGGADGGAAAMARVRAKAGERMGVADREGAAPDAV